MKREKVVCLLWSWAISFVVSFSGVACLVTAFDLKVALEQVAAWCALSAVVSGICFVLPLSLLPFGVGTFLCGYLWQQGSLELSIESLLYFLSRRYNSAYGWGIARWTFRVADEMELTLTLAVCALGVGIAMITAWTVCRRKPAGISLMFGFLPLLACLVVTDTTPDTIWLYLLLLSLVILLLTGLVRRQDMAQGNRALAYMTLPVAAALLILFVAAPQSRYAGQETAQKIADAVLRSDPVQALFGDYIDNGITGGAVSGDGVDLKNTGVRQESKAEILQVKTNYTGPLYLRGRALDAYDGISWQSSGVNKNVLNWPTYGLTYIGEVEISTRYGHRMLYVPYYAQGSQTQHLDLGLLNETQLTQYSFPCAVVDTSVLDKFATASASQMVLDGMTYGEKFTHLTQEVRSWAEPLVKELTKDCGSDYERAKVIGNYVRNSAVYDTNTWAMPKYKKDFVKWFLEDSDTGYCVHFASAATVLLQAAGIPARYVTGYYTQVVSGRTTSVEGRQAHAWAEYWLAGYGWVVLEATPAAAEETPIQTVPETKPEQQEGETQPVPDDQKTPDTPDKTPMDEPQGDSNFGNIVIAILYAVSVVAVVVGQYRFRLYLQNKALTQGAANRQVINRWFFAARLARYLKEQPPQELYQLAEKARFSQHKLGEEDVARLDLYLGQSVDRLKSRPVYYQIYYRLILALY